MENAVRDLINTYLLNVEYLEYLIIDFDLHYLLYETDKLKKTVSIRDYKLSGKFIYYHLLKNT